MEDKLYCIGCGIMLQSEDNIKEGYVNPNALNRDFILCKRCYQLKHYGRFNESKSLKNSIDLLKNNALKNDLIVLVFDVGLVYCPFNKILKELNYYNDVVLIGNRYDLYKEYIKKEKVYNFISLQAKRSNINYKKIFIIDNNIEEIFNYLDENSIARNVYFVGFENAGKTTLINNILKEIAHEENNLLVNSKYPGTTIDLIKIPMNDDNYLIDLPGIHSDGNFLSYVENNFIKKLNNDKMIKQVMYQLNDNQSLLISNVLRFDYLSGNKQSIIFYGSKMLDVMRCKLENATNTFNNRMIDLSLKSDKIKFFNDLERYDIIITDDLKYDIVIEGLGFFCLKKGKYRIYTFKGVNVFKRKSMI